MGEKETFTGDPVEREPSTAETIGGLLGAVPDVAETAQDVRRTAEVLEDYRPIVAGFQRMLPLVLIVAVLLTALIVIAIVA